jgi:hypothetical protein
MAIKRTGKSTTKKVKKKSQQTKTAKARSKKPSKTKPPEYQLVAQSTTYSYVAIWLAADTALTRAKENEAGRFYDCMNAMLMAPLAVEAHSNHVGALKVPGWPHLERKLDPT